jgi:hypothetical protein
MFVLSVSSSLDARCSLPRYTADSLSSMPSQAIFQYYVPGAVLHLSFYVLSAVIENVFCEKRKMSMVLYKFLPTRKSHV